MIAQQAVVGFANFRINCLIGIEPHERVHEQDIWVDIKVGIDCSEAVKTECVQDTVDYTLLAKICQEMAQEGRYQLLETYILAVLEKIIARFNLQWAWMQVKKTAALTGADYAYVEMRREAK